MGPLRIVEGCEILGEGGAFGMYERPDAARPGWLFFGAPAVIPANLLPNRIEIPVVSLRSAAEQRRRVWPRSR